MTGVWDHQFKGSSPTDLVRLGDGGWGKTTSEIQTIQGGETGSSRASGFGASTSCKGLARESVTRRRERETTSQFLL